MKFATKPIRRYPSHLRHVATLPWEIENLNFLQIFSRHGRKCKSCIFVASGFVIDTQILIFSVFNIASFSPYWLQIKIFHVTVLLLVYFCDQFLTSEIQCLSTINMVFSDEYKILIKTHKYTQHTQFLHLLPYLVLSLNICRKFEFLIFQGSVAKCLRWAGWCCIGFVAIFKRFPAVQNFWKSVEIW